MWNTFNTNVRGNINLIREYLAPAFPKAGKVIINVSTAAAHHTMPSLAAYGTSKQAVVTYLAHVQEEERDNGVRVVNFHPGAILTDMARGVGYDEGSPIPWSDGEFPCVYELVMRI